MCPTKKTIFLMVAIALALSIAHTVEATEELDMEEETGEEEATIVDLYLNSLRGVSSFLPQHKVTCKTDPAICKVKGSPGPYCCKKVCVNLETDHRNCGACKNKCKNTQMCCSGSCVPSYTGCGALPA